MAAASFLCRSRSQNGAVERVPDVPRAWRVGAQLLSALCNNRWRKRPAAPGTPASEPDAQKAAVFCYVREDQTCIGLQVKPFVKIPLWHQIGIETTDVL